jgi:hypothetical protein
LRAGRGALIAAVAGAALTVMPSTTLAQIGVPRGWTPTVGARAGWAIEDASPSLGLFLRVPIPLPVLGPTLIVAGDAVFQGGGLVDRQGTIDLTTDVLGGLYVGGGPAVLDTFFGNEAVARETKIGYTLVAGASGRVGLLTSHFELRWVRVDVRKPRFLMFGLSYPIFGRP